MIARELARVRCMLADVEIRGPIPARVRASTCVDGVRVTVALDLPDRATGALRTFERGIAPVTGDDVLAKVREALRALYEHEIDEGLYHRGRRPFDPHPGDP